jgi:uroporphyrinogen-III decarboxylase
MFYLRGFEAVLLDLAEEREEAYQLRDLILKHILDRIEALRAFDVDGFLLRDDWGAQDRLLLSPTLWRKFFQPAYRQIAAASQAAGKHLEFHTDGQTRDILPDLVEIGCQVLNPQMTVVGIDWLSRTLGGRVCLHTDLDRQHILPHGTPDEVAHHVHEALAAFGRFNGGCLGGGEISPDVPLENAEAMLRAVWEHRF